MRFLLMLLCAASLGSGLDHRHADPRDAGGRDVAPRVAIFYEAGFPSIDAPSPSIAALRNALSQFDLSVLDADALNSELDSARFDVLVMPSGSSFPQRAWPAILRFLSSGGSLVNLGGAPFAVPVRRGDGGSWRIGARTATYHKELGLLQEFAVPARSFAYSPAASEYASLSSGLAAENIFELTIRLASSKTLPDEDGSEGEREGRVKALVTASSGGQQPPVAAPVVQVDRIAGKFAGGRWILASGDRGVPPAAVVLLVRLAAAGPADLTVRPQYAGFHPGEQLSIAVAANRTEKQAAAGVASACEVKVSRDGRQIAAATAPLAKGRSAAAKVVVPVDSSSLAPGLYAVSADCAEQGWQASTGFWIYENAMVAGGKALTAGRDYFALDGKPFAVAGTTYMASDAHRAFLLEPNPLAWDGDMRAIRNAGANMLRTGIWTGWSHLAEADGQPTEAALRAIEVFMLTARQHDLPVVFNFFAFTPPQWGGSNPYFDPKALSGQKRFVGAIANRLKGANDLAWDLINEPSFSSPSRLWSCRPNYDEHELLAWQAWNLGPVNLPSPTDFGDKNLFGLSRPDRASDYRRFAQASFTNWVKDISSAIHANGNKRQLITVGQDEGGAGERPNPLIFGTAVDFTGTHTWWNNDALLWDAVMAKRPDKPSLVEETGLMTYERADGSAWRSEIDARNLLERKMALAFANNGAGFIQWLWNTNVYMPIDNEAGIGLLRADGTAKPELDAFARFANFFRGVEPTPGSQPPVAIIVSHSNVFSARDQTTAATQRAVRTFEYDLRVPVRAISEYETEEIAHGQLLVLPSPRMLTDAAWDAISKAVEAGATLLVTGVFDRDEYESPTGRLAALGLHASVRPVASENRLTVGKTAFDVPYRSNKLERLERAVVERAPHATVHVVPRGKGRIIWCPLPIELGDDTAATKAVYAMALRAAGIPQRARFEGEVGAGLLVHPVDFDDTILYVVVNESDTDRTLRFGTRKVLVQAERGVLVLVDRKTRRVIKTTADKP